MRFLARAYHYYTKELPEYQRLIEREMKLIDLSAIFTIDEFMDLVVVPTAQGKSPLAKLFQKYAGKIDVTLRHWAQHDDVEYKYSLDFEKLREETQALMLEKYSEKSLLARKTSTQREEYFLEDIKGYKNDPDYQGHSELGINRNYPALQLLVISTALDVINGKKKDTLEKMIYGSLWCGHGQEALDFLKRLSALKDYSGFFPNKRKPKGNNSSRRDERQVAGAGELQPQPAMIPVRN
ncbi:MAG: hypothetical protein MRY79_06695 [Alphaproteobacteria bacterium]|nr:hypothetical protein [Alphaproteobacteria bacterium]